MITLFYERGCDRSKRAFIALSDRGAAFLCREVTAKEREASSVGVGPVLYEDKEPFGDLEDLLEAIK